MISNVSAHKALLDYVNWFSYNLLVLNQKKSHYFLFSLRNISNAILLYIKIDNCCISHVNQTKFLGIIIDEHLTWKHHINSIRDKMSKGIAVLKLSAHFMPSDCLLLLYIAFLYCHTCLIV